MNIVKWIGAAVIAVGVVRKLRKLKKQTEPNKSTEASITVEDGSVSCKIDLNSLFSEERNKLKKVFYNIMLATISVVLMIKIRRLSY